MSPPFIAIPMLSISLSSKFPIFLIDIPIMSTPQFSDSISIVPILISSLTLSIPITPSSSYSISISTLSYSS